MTKIPSFGSLRKIEKWRRKLDEVDEEVDEFIDRNSMTQRLESEERKKQEEKIHRLMSFPKRNTSHLIEYKKLLDLSRSEASGQQKKRVMRSHKLNKIKTTGKGFPLSAHYKNPVLPRLIPM